MTEHFGPAERFAVGAIGEPGERTFLAHVVANAHSHWFVAEKGQIQALADYALEALARADILPDPEAMRHILSRLELDAPDEIDFRIGSISLAVQPTSDLITIEFTSVDESETVDFVVAPEQLQAMAIRGLDVVGKGRPICRDCQLPMDPDGHQCPSTNGHHPRES